MRKTINVYIYRFRGKTVIPTSPVYRHFFFPTPHQTKKTNNTKGASQARLFGSLLLSARCVDRESRVATEQIRSIDRQRLDDPQPEIRRIFQTHFPCQHMHATTPTKKRVTRSLCVCLLIMMFLSRTVTFLGFGLRRGGRLLLAVVGWRMRGRQSVRNNEGWCSFVNRAWPLAKSTVVTSRPIQKPIHILLRPVSKWPSVSASPTMPIRET